MWNSSKVKTWKRKKGNLLESGPLGSCSSGEKLSFLNKFYVQRVISCEGSFYGKKILKLIFGRVA